MDCVVVRYGAIGTKSAGVRARMEAQLRENVAAVLRDRGLGGSVERLPGRLVVRRAEPDRPARCSDARSHRGLPSFDRAAAAAASVPGVVSASPVRETAPEMDAIRAALVALADERSVDTYAVRANRARDDHPFTSPELEREGGAAVGAAVEASVDLEEPAVTFEADVRPDRAFVFADRVDGPGGLPVGSQAPLVALVSGGIDSPVAAYEAMCRGSPVVPVYVDLGDYGGVDHRTRAVAAAGRLGDVAPNFDGRPYVVSGGAALADLADRVDRGRMLAVRRYFFAAAAEVAATEDAAGVVTGEVLGQKSSQTARNLQVTSAAVDLPIHRPLLARDKPDIVDRARALGTDETAEIQAGCNRLVPETPETDGRLARLVELEPDDLLERAAADARDADRVTPEP
jgi:thiamine biosynthesis protein ThiI